jgi:pSer/pThr/pTyr-binding forkhead associated (FHA) protein
VLDPVAVGLKFGFIAILYLFLLWVARSALKDLKRTGGRTDGDEDPIESGTGLYSAAAGLGHTGGDGQARLRVMTAPGLRDGVAYDVTGGAILGRGDQADIRLEDTFSSSQHARLIAHGGQMVIEDLGSTNGTYLNGEPLTGPQPLHPGDRIRIGDSEFSFER